MVRADFVTGLVFIALGIAVAVESLRMPRFADLEINPYTVPGLVPGMLGVIILILGSALFLRATRAGGWRLGAPGRGTGSGSTEPGVRRLALSLLLCLGYAAGLVGRIPFWLATLLFVAAFVVAFEWPLATSRTERMRRVIFALVFAAAVSAGVTWTFQHVFLVRLP